MRLFIADVRYKQSVREAGTCVQDDDVNGRVSACSVGSLGELALGKCTDRGIFPTTVGNY